MAVIRKNGKIYEDRTVKGYKYVYEVTISPVTGKKKFNRITNKNEEQSLLSSFGYRKTRKTKSKASIKNIKERIFEEFGNTPETKYKLKDIEGKLEDQGKTLDDISYQSLASKMIGTARTNKYGELDIEYTELDRAKKLIRNLGYTEEEFQNIYGISAEQLSHSKTADGEITIGNKVYAIKWNYTGYEDLVLLRTL